MATFSPPSTVLERLSDRYALGRPIGRPFGYQQMLAKDRQQQQSVVIKSLTVEENTPTGDICCFEREIQLLESLNHPTIPRYIDSFTVDTTQEGKGRSKGLILVQSHHEGETLAQQVAAGKTYSEAEIKEIARQLLKGLVYLHSKGLVHRDIKPDNVAIAHPKPGIKQVSWLNLGTVQYVQAQRNDALVGTYGYMPPEQVGGQATFASDLYSLGATLIYLATGRHLGDLPHRPNSGGMRMKFACSPAKLSPSFQQWINWLVEPYVGDRPASAKRALGSLNRLPISMLKRRILQPTQAQMLPVPIMTGNQDRYQPFFTRIRAVKKLRSLELVVPPVGLKSKQAKRALPPLLMGLSLLGVALHLLSLLHFSPAMLASPNGLFSLVASASAASLAIVSCFYSLRFMRNGFRLLNMSMLREVHIQLEADVLLVAYKYWGRSPVYVVNTKRADIYSISALPGEQALRILTHHNRTQKPRDCYKLSLADGAMSRRDMRWLTSLMNDWRNHSGSCTAL